MKYYYLDSHSFVCDHQSEFGRKYCEQNPEHFIFFVKNKFVMIDYHCCIGGGDHIDFKKTLIKSLINNSKIFESYEIRKSVDVKEDLREFRIRNNPLKKWVYQIHYIYGQSRKYCIASKVKYMDAVCNADEIRSNYLESKEYLIKNEKCYLLDELTALYLSNPVYNIDEIEVCKTIDHIVDSINKINHHANPSQLRGSR